MTSDVTPKIDELTHDNSGRMYFDMYLYSIASIRRKDRVLKFASSLPIGNAKNLQLLHTVLGIIDRYRDWKSKPEFKHGDDSINFHKMGQAIEVDLISSDIVLFEDPEGKSLPVTISMANVDLGFIDYIIKKIAEWESVNDPFMQDEQEETEKTLLT